MEAIIPAAYGGLAIVHLVLCSERPLGARAWCLEKHNLLTAVLYGALFGCYAHKMLAKFGF